VESLRVAVPRISRAVAALKDHLGLAAPDLFEPLVSMLRSTAFIDIASNTSSGKRTSGRVVSST